ncbi:MAG: hypothetical protein IPI58_01685 [Alphaproteobacteria bacterium]|nr:MAG: hypothetical protein IPI58_01685 [Alphaproteobacteria bacterium]
MSYAACSGRWAWALALLVGVCCAGTVEAAGGGMVTVPTVSPVTGPWAVQKSGQSKVQPACSARANFENGLQLYLIQNAARDVMLRVAVPKAGFADGEAYDVSLALDQKEPNIYPASTKAPDLIEIKLGQANSALSVWKQAKVLLLTGPEDAARFSLNGLPKALSALETCVKTLPRAEVAVNKEDSAAALPVAAPASPQVTPQKVTVSAKLTKAFPEGLARLLQSAGLGDVTPVDVSGTPRDQRPTDFVWKRGPVIGGAREQKITDAGVTFDQARNRMLDAFRTNCQGTFKMKEGKTETYTDISLSPVQLDCKGKAGDMHVALLFYMTTDKLFVMFMHEAPQAHAKKADAMRDALARFLGKLASDPQRAKAP